MADTYYRAPGWFTTHVLNRAISLLTLAGFGPRGSRILEVRGRTTARPRRTPVNLLTVAGERYLVAPRGETQWARNLRAAAGGVLILGRRREGFTATELPDADKPPILRAYLQRWYGEAGAFFDGVDADSTDAEVSRIAPQHPVFRLTASQSRG